MQHALATAMQRPSLLCQCYIKFLTRPPTYSTSLVPCTWFVAFLLPAAAAAAGAAAAAATEGTTVRPTPFAFHNPTAAEFVSDHHHLWQRFHSWLLALGHVPPARAAALRWHPLSCERGVAAAAATTAGSRECETPRPASAAVAHSVFPPVSPKAGVARAHACVGGGECVRETE